LGVQSAFFAVTLVFTKLTWPKHKDPWALADTLSSAIVYPLMVYLAVSGASGLSVDIDLRWRGNTYESSAFLILYVTRTLLHMFMQTMQDMSPKQFMLMTIHHCLSLLCMGNGLVTGNMHYWGCLAGVCEMTTMFLNNVWLCKEVNIKGEPLQSYIPAWAYALNGLLLWFGFIVFRLVLFPFWLYQFHNDVHTAPGRTWEISSLVEKYAYVLVVSFLLALSTYWMLPITKGLMKALGLLTDWNDSPKKDD